VGCANAVSFFAANIAFLKVMNVATITVKTAWQSCKNKWMKPLFHKKYKVYEWVVYFFNFCKMMYFNAKNIPMNTAMDGRMIGNNKMTEDKIK
jgi:hypothetical protein